MLMSSETSSQTVQEVMLHQLTGHPLVQSNWHIKLPILGQPWLTAPHAQRWKEVIPQGKGSRLQDTICTVVCSFSTWKTLQWTALCIFLYKCPTIFQRPVHRCGIDRLWQIVFQKCFTNLCFDNVWKPNFPTPSSTLDAISLKMLPTQWTKGNLWFFF